jgi:nitrate ABC transporter ATP-binding subunit
MNPTTSIQRRFLELHELGKSYPAPGGGRSVIVRDFSLVVPEGEFVSLIGHSGCGKSTVLSMIAGLTTISEGGIVVGGRQIDGPGTDRGVVFQSPSLLPWLTALENVRLSVVQAHPELSRKEQKTRAAYYLELVGLGDALNRRPRALSGGMRQRVGIARAFALSPKLLLLDEPFGMLDSITRFELQEILLSLWQKHQMTAFMVTHDVDEALFLSNRVAMMTSGPAATLGKLLEVPFERPRDREAIMADPRYYGLREQLIGFLEEQETSGPSGPSDFEDDNVIPVPGAEERAGDGESLGAESLG